GAAANILAAHPGFTPDQVKGAIMLTAKAGNKLGDAGGVGVIQSEEATRPSNPPNPNAALEQFVKSSNSNGSGTTYSFDSASWNSAVQANASWNSASWNSASWNSASWNDASWNSVSWNSASNEDAAEGDAAADPSSLTLGSDDI